MFSALKISVCNAYSVCLPNVRVRIKRAIRALPTEYLKPLYDGELFESAETYLRRLKEFILN